MLPASARLTRPAEFGAVLRGGRRSGAGTLAVHLLAPAAGSAGPARVGFVVSSKVGNSVVRHRVTRRLREQIRPLLAGLPEGTSLVVRAFPAAAASTSAVLGADLRSALRRLRAR